MTAAAKAHPQRSTTALLAWAIAIAAVVRLTSLALYPLSDTTESRYAEVARKMLELGDWVTPWYDHGVPFWAKPPMSMWLTAASFASLGVNEFAARLPHFLAGMLVLWLAWDWLRHRSPREALLTAALLCGAGVFYVSAGAVMTDMTLCVGLTLAMRGFWEARQGTPGKRVRNHLLLCLGLLIGLLAKGPIALVLAGLPIAAWCVLTGHARALWRTLPWLMASMLMAAPWYLLAESKTPGFLDYFLVGEHWKRFTTAGWAGDRYGSAHAYPRGSVWLFALMACLPWTVLLPWLAIGRKKPADAVAPSAADRPWRTYLLVWGMAPCVFFTLSGNVLSTYVLPGLPALAMLAAGWLVSDTRTRRVDCVLTIGLMVMSAAICAAAVGQHLSGGWKTARGVVERYQSLKTGDEPLVFVKPRPYSAAFYSRGLAVEVTDIVALRGRIGTERLWLAFRRGHEPRLPNDPSVKLEREGRYGDYDLYRIDP